MIVESAQGVTERFRSGDPVRLLTSAALSRGRARGGCSGRAGTASGAVERYNIPGVSGISVLTGPSAPLQRSGAGVIVGP